MGSIKELWREALQMAGLAVMILLTAIVTSGSIRAQGVVINEVMASNQTTIPDDNGDYSDWVEIYNAGLEPVNLSGYGLSDARGNPFKWIFPEVIIAPKQYLLIWASNKNRRNPAAPLHTNFAISAAGEEIVLTRPNGMLLSEIPPTPMGADISFGHQPDASGNLYFFSTPSPGTSNISQGYLGILAAPSLSLAPGFYQGSQELIISHPDPLAKIYYTLDGNTPSGGSILYQDAITIQQQLSSSTGINMIRTNPPEADPLGFGWKAPGFFHSKATVVRAAAIREGFFTPAPATATYFIDMLPPELPVVSLAIDTFFLFNNTHGLYIPGIDYETNGYGGGFYGTPNANYFRTGEHWEMPSHFSFFESGKQVLGQNAGVRIHGGGTRALPQKSLRVYARGGYGAEFLGHPFFPGQKHTRYKRVLLRNAGQDFFGPGTMMRDGFIQKLAEPIGVPIQDYRPAILYLNGEYWGIQNLRERYDKHYFERKYGIPQEQLDYMENDMLVEEGTDEHYRAMIRYIAENPLSEPEAYAYIKTQMNIENFIDYNIINIFAANIDWPAHNLKYFRRRTPYNPSASFANDGRWHWALNDLDFGFSWSGLFDHQFDMMTHVTDPQGSDWPPNLPWSTFLIRSLLKNQSFSHSFINRFADLLNTIFRPEQILAIINTTKAQIEPEIEKHILRWGYPAANMNQWRANTDRLAFFATHRPTYQKAHIINYFNLQGTYNLSLDVSQSSHGTLKVNNLHLHASNPLTPTFTDYPWTGEYFSGVPVPITALPGPGYRLQKWVNTIGEEFFENPLFISHQSDIKYTAIFEADNTSNPALSELQLSIYPNPASNRLFVRLPLPVTNALVHIINLQGAVVFSIEIAHTGHEFELDLSALSHGFYFIRFISGQNQRSARFLKK